MEKNGSLLPDGFEELAALAARWAHPTENARSQIRWAASPADFAELYDAVMPRLEAILAYLSGFTTNDMPADARCLFDLACAFAEASPHHELYQGSAEVPFSFAAHRFVPAHGDLPT